MKTQKSGNPRATLTEVAERAGVSTTTASLVLGGKADQHRISEATYQRVKQAADELDYAPNLLVRSMQRGRTHVLSFFDAFRNRKYDDLYRDRLTAAIERAAGRYGYDILTHCDFSRSPTETYRFLNGGRADGLLLFAPEPDDPLLPLLRASRLPVVLINARDDEGILPSVKDDVVSGMRQVADTLLRLGHCRIAVLDEPGVHPDARERIELLRSCLRAEGVELPDAYIVDFRTDRPEKLARLLSASEPPTALFIWHDFLAYNTLAICEALGVAVPDQVSIVGYDGLPWPTATRHTAASVAVDLQMLANEAIRLLDCYIGGYTGEVIQEVLPVTLIPGTTLGTAPSHC